MVAKCTFSSQTSHKRASLEINRRKNRRGSEWASERVNQGSEAAGESRGDNKPRRSTSEVDLHSISLRTQWTHPVVSVSCQHRPLCWDDTSSSVFETVKETVALLRGSRKDERSTELNIYHPLPGQRI